MELYRIAQEHYAHDLSGNGARIYGGRWNSEGILAVYTSSSRSLALLEILAHTPIKMLQDKTYMLVTLVVPGNVDPELIDTHQLNEGWDAQETQTITKRIGDEFLKTKSSLLLSVPSVLIPEENNYLLNPLHPGMKKVKMIFQRRIWLDKRVSGNL